MKIKIVSKLTFSLAKLVSTSICSFAWTSASTSGRHGSARFDLRLINSASNPRDLSCSFLRLSLRVQMSPSATYGNKTDS